MPPPDWEIEHGSFLRQEETEKVNCVLQKTLSPVKNYRDFISILIYCGVLRDLCRAKVGVIWGKIRHSGRKYMLFSLLAWGSFQTSHMRFVL